MQKGKVAISSWLLIGLILITVIYRLVAANYSFLGNTTPLMAVCFGGALLLGVRFWWIPLLLLVCSDLILGIAISGSGLGWYTLFSALFYTTIALFANRMGRWSGRNWPTLWCGTLLASLGFYLFANTFAWALSPEYAKTLSGWWQSQTTGLPQYSPQSWVFLRNALIADTVWCVIAGLLFLGSKSQTSPAESKAAA